MADRYKMEFWGDDLIVDTTGDSFDTDDQFGETESDLDAIIKACSRERTTGIPPQKTKYPLLQLAGYHVDFSKNKVELTCNSAQTNYVSMPELRGKQIRNLVADLTGLTKISSVGEKINRNGRLFFDISSEKGVITLRYHGPVPEKHLTALNDGLAAYVVDE